MKQLAGLKPTKQYFLYPSTIFVDRSPYTIQTVLGSCVAVCLYDTRERFGGMSHFMLSIWKGNGLPSPKYGNIAIKNQVENMIGLGGSKKHLIAKIFGGADLIENLSNYYQIGANNVTITMEMLDQYKIPVEAKSTGGVLGRKITFNNQSGEVLMRYIEKSK